LPTSFVHTSCTLHLAFLSFFHSSPHHLDLHSFPTRRSSDLHEPACTGSGANRGHPFRRRKTPGRALPGLAGTPRFSDSRRADERSEEHTSELQSRVDLVCRLLLEKKKEKLQDRLGCAHTYNM